MAKTDRRKRVRRSSASPSQSTVTARMREAFIDGFGWPPFGADDNNVDKIRNAMRTVAADDRYWESVKKIQALKRETRNLQDAVKQARAH